MTGDLDQRERLTISHTTSSAAKSCMPALVRCDLLHVLTVFKFHPSLTLTLLLTLTLSLTDHDFQSSSISDLGSTFTMTFNFNCDLDFNLDLYFNLDLSLQVDEPMEPNVNISFVDYQTNIVRLAKHIAHCSQDMVGPIHSICHLNALVFGYCCPIPIFFTAAAAIALHSKIHEIRTCALGGW
jgi:hypothetical protein